MTVLLETDLLEFTKGFEDSSNNAHEVEQNANGSDALSIASIYCN